MVDEIAKNRASRRYVSREDLSVHLGILLQDYPEGGFKTEHIRSYVSPLVERLKDKLPRGEKPSQIVLNEAKRFLEEQGWQSYSTIHKKGYYRKEY
ncbi:hypothetical protein J4437_00025 [Candidatus Woesearchaeota archaeon]|nr:hypothetical protein [Candidatus Woesearchaeota archaeon]